MGKLLKQAHMFTLDQRIRELERAIDHWPNSQRCDDRKIELVELLQQKEELQKEINEL